MSAFNPLSARDQIPRTKNVVGALRQLTKFGECYFAGDVISKYALVSGGTADASGRAGGFLSQIGPSLSQKGPSLARYRPPCSPMHPSHRPQSLDSTYPTSEVGHGQDRNR